LGAIFKYSTRNNIDMNRSFILLLFAVILINSCKNQDTRIIEPKEISRYKVQITYSSFFDCGDYKKVLIDNKWEEEPVYKSKIKNYYLYIFDIEGNCDNKTKIDTIAVKLSILQSDSIFKLANSYVDNLIIYDPKVTGMRTVVMDGSDIKVEVCYENKCKAVTIYHYEKMSTDLLSLISYIDSIK
jgi:hypothetical protein